MSSPFDRRESYGDSSMASVKEVGCPFLTPSQDVVHVLRSQRDIRQ